MCPLVLNYGFLAKLCIATKCGPIPSKLWCSCGEFKTDCSCTSSYNLKPWLCLMFDMYLCKTLIRRQHIFNHFFFFFFLIYYYLWLVCSCCVFSLVLYVLHRLVLVLLTVQIVQFVLLMFNSRSQCISTCVSPIVILGGDWDRGQGPACREDPCNNQCGVQKEKNREGFCPGTPYKISSHC